MLTAAFIVGFTVSAFGIIFLRLPVGASNMLVVPAVWESLGVNGVNIGAIVIGVAIRIC